MYVVYAISPGAGGDFRRQQRRPHPPPFPPPHPPAGSLVCLPLASQCAFRCHQRAGQKDTEPDPLSVLSAVLRRVLLPVGLAFNCSSTSTNYHRCSKAALTSCSTSSSSSRTSTCSSGRLVHYELLSDDEKMDLPVCPPLPHSLPVARCPSAPVCTCVPCRVCNRALNVICLNNSP